MSALLGKAFADGGPRLGFGTGDVYGRDRAEASRRLIDSALDHGFRYIDTARLYGDGSAESVIGAALAGRRDQVVLASKVGILPWRMRRGLRIAHRVRRLARKGGGLARALVAAPEPAGALFGAFGLGQLRRSLEASLKALRTDHLDILLLHECTPADALRPEIQDFLARVVQEGKVRHCGIAATVAATAEILDRKPPTIEIVQGPSDARERNLPLYRRASGGFVVTHSVLKTLLPEIAARARADAAYAARFAETTGADGRDPAAVATLLLAHALRENSEGVVLFSTLKPERAAAVRKALSDASFSAEQFSGLEQAVAERLPVQNPPENLAENPAGLASQGG
ncbi:aldo/keto reductase [Pelagibius sp.]|uniref:aldo/keto reductase n=1 Tax=Pelagibius sp. TaxID=1931238 RepID=UPI0026167563|nr:aldo/keto reductase [Pelagibius sp.]